MWVGPGMPKCRYKPFCDGFEGRIHVLPLAQGYNLVHYIALAVGWTGPAGAAPSS